MKIFGIPLPFTQKAAGNAMPVDGRGGWWPIIRESFTGAWQQNVEVKLDTVLSYTAVFRCISLIASDIAKMRIRLMRRDSNGVWKETTSAAYSPVLRKPNRYQNRIQFFQAWIESKMKTGNAVVLKERDGRGVVTSLHVLDWCRVTPLVAPDGSVYYQLKRDDLAGIGEDLPAVPASEIIHDRWQCLFHPLVGLSPIYACGLAATQGRAIQNNSAAFFANGSNPGGILTAPGAISQEAADRLKQTWQTGFTGKNFGKVAVLSDGMTYSAMAVKAVDAQLVEQLKWTSEDVCTAFGVPPYKIGVGATPSYNNVEAMDVQYFTQCLQIHIESIELCLDEGLAIGTSAGDLGTEFDLDDLMRLDAKTQIDILKNSDGIMTPNEQRLKLNKGPVTGGDVVYKQEQDHSLEALSKRDNGDDPFGKGKAAAAAPPAEPVTQSIASQATEPNGTISFLKFKAATASPRKRAIQLDEAA